MKNTTRSLFAMAVLALAASAGWAADGHDQHHAPVATAQSVAALTAGEVRKVDTAQGKVTIRHEPIANLDMPAMTTVFRATKPELLKNLKAGDRIRFRAESEAGALVVTQVEPAR